MNVKITYVGDSHGYWRVFEPDTTQELDNLYDLQGTIDSKDPRAIDFLEDFYCSEDCPLVFKEGDDTVREITIELL